MAYNAAVREMDGDTASSFVWGDLRETVKTLNKDIQDGGLSARCQYEAMEEEERRSMTPEEAEPAAAQEEKEKKMTEEEMQKRMELRRRLRKKKNEDTTPKGPSLLERIMLQRKVVAAAQAVREKGANSPPPETPSTSKSQEPKEVEKTKHQTEEVKDLEHVDEELDSIIDDIMRKPARPDSGDSKEKGTAGKDAMAKANEILDGGLFTEEELELARQAQANGDDLF